MEVWVANVTTFVDDYKLRGRDPSDSWGPRLFATEKLAKQWVANRLFDYFEDEEWSASDIVQVYNLNDEDFFYDEKYDIYTPHRDRKNDYDYMTSIGEYMGQGEFVPRSITWDISKQSVEGEVKRMKRSKSQ